jgi:hypothetical protein
MIQMLVHSHFYEYSRPKSTFTKTKSINLKIYVKISIDSHIAYH